MHMCWDHCKVNHRQPNTNTIGRLYKFRPANVSWIENGSLHDNEPSTSSFHVLVQRKTALLPDSEEDGNIWEESGLFEGDIMTYGGLMRNGISSEERRWPNATVPYYIDDSFCKLELKCHCAKFRLLTVHLCDWIQFPANEDTELLIGAMQEYHDRTCVRFRPYTREDSNWIELRSDFGGCWSSVGMREEGQVVNLNAPRCIRHGKPIVTPFKRRIVDKYFFVFVEM